MSSLERLRSQTQDQAAQLNEYAAENGRLTDELRSLKAQLTVAEDRFQRIREHNAHLLRRINKDLDLADADLGITIKKAIADDGRVWFTWTVWENGTPAMSSADRTMHEAACALRRHSHASALKYGQVPALIETAPSPTSVPDRRQ